jgi:hypothetical protein
MGSSAILVKDELGFLHTDAYLVRSLHENWAAEPRKLSGYFLSFSRI